ncbi:hypothetical protein Tcan_11582 [Toxocara canis]|uniref:Uncharacterized protein n=1 Tax=Toxocara canis TaxID=6265 RepID=A0A0B2VZX2_TOXCA|nr:hypothetical protein Tcan_11582 [Toxocara canis]
MSAEKATPCYPYSEGEGGVGIIDAPRLCGTVSVFAWVHLLGRCEQSEVNCEETCYGVREAAVRIWAGRLAAASGGGCGNGGGRDGGRGSGNIGGGNNSNGELVDGSPATSSGSGYSGRSPIGGVQVTTIDGGNGRHGLDGVRPEYDGMGAP